MDQTRCAAVYSRNVKANGGIPFHNTAEGTIAGDEITVSGSQENTRIREYRIVLKRLK